MEKEERVNSLKRYVFYELLAETGRVMALVRYSPEVVIGRRGFVGEERKSGLTLAFNDRMKFIWDDYGITATLTFGSSPQKCFIPAGSIAAVYSPEMRVQLFAAVGEKGPDKSHTPPDTFNVEESGNISGKGCGNVINVDFINRKRVDNDETGGEDA
jgi:hypothetical protein